MIEEQGIRAWVDEKPQGDQREFREAVHTILSAIASDPGLKATMVIKGGILLAIRYHSHRFTKDIDFSTSQILGEIDKDEIAERLDKRMAEVAEILDYDLLCRVQSCKVQPAKKPDAKFPSIKMKIGYSYKTDPKFRRLQARQCPTSIDIDFSLNELMPNIEEYEISDGEKLTAYSLADLIAEKLRSVLQQKKRGRKRRQDIFDLFLLIEMFPDLAPEEKCTILESLITKSHSRDISPNPSSLRDEEIRSRSEAEYPTLADEIDGDLPDFDKIYSAVQEFYEALPWQLVS